MKEMKEQIDRIYAEAEKAGRKDRPRIWVTFRPILAETEEVSFPSKPSHFEPILTEFFLQLAWAKAHRTLEALERNAAKGTQNVLAHGWKAEVAAPQNVGSQRLLDIAKKGEVQDRALWYPTVTATGARGASTALVGTPQVIADSILDYVKLGADLISIRGYDNLGDVTDYGRFILPKVRAALVEEGSKA